MTWWKEIKGMPVVSVAEGKELGKVDTLLIDPDDGSIRWVQLAKGGFFGETRVISVHAVQAIGENAITVDSEASAMRIDEVPDAQELAREKRRVLGNRILTNKGRLLGEIRDYEIDAETFRITRYEIGKSDLLGARSRYVAADHVLTIGPDAVLVDAAVESELLAAEPEEVQQPPPEKAEEEAKGTEEVTVETGVEAEKAAPEGETPEEDYGAFWSDRR